MNFDKLKSYGIEPKINDLFSQLPDEAILSPADVALLLNRNKETVRRWCRLGKLPSYNWGGKYAICASDFKEFMKHSQNHNSYINFVGESG